MPNGQKQRLREYMKKRDETPKDMENYTDKSSIENLEKVGAFNLAKQREEGYREKLRKNLIEEGALVAKDHYLAEFVPIVKELWKHICDYPDTIAPYLHGLKKADIRKRLIKENEKLSKEFIKFLDRLKEEGENVEQDNI